MAAWSSLTPTQQKQVTDYVTFLRGLAGQFARVMQHMDADNVSWNQTVSALVTGLDALTVIPDNTSLAGAAPLAREDVINITGYCQSVLTSFYDAAHKGVLSSACGPSNMIG